MIHNIYVSCTSASTTYEQGVKTASSSVLDAKSKSAFYQSQLTGGLGALAALDPAGSDNVFTHLDEIRNGILERHVLAYVSINTQHPANTA